MTKHRKALAAIPGVVTTKHAKSGHIHLLDADGRLLASCSLTPRVPAHALRNAHKDVQRRLRALRSGA